MIDFALTAEQESMRQAAATFAPDFLSTAREIHEKEQTRHARFRSLRTLYGKAVKAGLVAEQIPQALSGAGGPLTEAAILVEEIYATDNSAALTILATGLGLLPLIFCVSCRSFCRKKGIHWPAKSTQSPKVRRTGWRKVHMDCTQQLAKMAKIGS